MKNYYASRRNLLSSSQLYVAKKNGSEGHYSNNQQVKVWIEGLGEVDFDELVYYLGGFLIL